VAKLLVFGASGQIGDSLLARLLEAGHQLVGVSRVARAPRERLQWLVGDLDRALPALPACDAIFSLGPLDRFSAWFAHTRPPVAAVIAVSSMSAESKRHSPDPRERALAQRLRDAEQTLLGAASSMQVACTVFRPTMLYGAGRDRSVTRLARFAQRWHLFPLLPGARGLRQPLHVADLAQACSAAWQHRTKDGRVIEIGGGECLTFAELLQRVRASIGAFALPLPLPMSLLRALAPARYRAAIVRLQSDLLADNHVVIAELGVRPRAFLPDRSCWQAASAA
jgi:nucleoside-diphosphate-sugar epimerase